MQNRRRIPHVVRPHVDNAFPNSFIFFDTETKGFRVPGLRGVSRQRLWFGQAIAIRLRENGQSRTVYKRFETGEEFFAFLKSRLDKCRPLYVFAHNLGFDATIVDFWHWAESSGLKVIAPCFQDPPTFLYCKLKGCRIKFIDTLNYWRNSLKDLGKDMQLKKYKMPSAKASQKVWDKYCLRDVEIIAKAILELGKYMKDNDLGNFGVSTPAISMSTFKKRFLKHKIFIHDDLTTCKLERRAYYGGLVDCFYVGKVPADVVYKLDVNSLYPHCMLGKFPTKLIDRVRDESLPRFARMAKDYGAVAEVEIRSDERTYPIRYDDRLCFVNGHFQTYLCGPELMRAYRAGDIVKLTRVAYYETAAIFTDFVNHFWKERRRFKELGSEVHQYFCKIILNSLYGKWGQMGYTSQPLTVATLQEIYAYYKVPFPDCYLDKDRLCTAVDLETSWKPVDLGRRLTLRRIANRIEVNCPPSEHSESFPAIAGFVTAIAREYLRKLILVAGRKNVYYCDTDSLFTNETGYANLDAVGYVCDKTMGKLKVEDWTSHCHIYCPKEYTFGRKHTRKGIRPKATSLGNGVFRQLQFEGLKRVLSRGGEAYIDIATIRKRNSRQYLKGVVTRNGWTTPYSLQYRQSLLTPLDDLEPEMD